MTIRKRYWLLAIPVAVAILFIGVYIAGQNLRGRLEPMVREQAIRYLQDRFHADVQLAALHIHLPRLSTVGLVFHRQRGAIVNVDGEGLSVRRAGVPLLAVNKLHFTVDIASVTEAKKTVDAVSLEGVRITVPPKGEAGAAQSGSGTRGKKASLSKCRSTRWISATQPC